MKPILSSILLGALLAVAGCSSTPSQVDSGPIRASSFAFLEPAGNPPAANAETRKSVHATLQDAITQNLGDRGVTRTSSNPDVLVGYLIILGDGVVTIAIDDYFGASRSSLEVQERAHRAYGKNENPNGFAAGTLVLDILDAKTFKLLRRSHVTRPLLRQPAEEVRREHLQGAVAEALKGLQVVH